MEDSSNTPALGNLEKPVIRDVKLRELEQHKDAILDLYNSPGIRLEDLPRIAEENLHIRAG